MLAAFWVPFILFEAGKNDISSQSVVKQKSDEISGKPPAALLKKQDTQAYDQEKKIFYKIIDDKAAEKK